MSLNPNFVAAGVRRAAAGVRERRRRPQVRHSIYGKRNDGTGVGGEERGGYRLGREWAESQRVAGRLGQI
jgi:hypothetical protein